MDAVNVWTILVSGYGAFLFTGTEQQAENARANKSRWERAIARKRLATADEIATGVADACWNHAGFVVARTFLCRCQRCADGVLSADDIARELGITRSAVYGRRRRGTLPAPVGSNLCTSLYWRRSDLVAAGVL